MTIGDSRLSEAAAHQELILMDSRVAGVIEETFFDRFRRRDLAHFDVLEQFDRLMAETRVCGGKTVHLGKIISNEIIEFLESEPDVPSGLQLSTGLKVLPEIAPFLGPLLVSISSVVEGHGFGRAFAETNFSDKLERQARIFFSRFAHIMNMTKGLLSSQDNMSLDVVTFEEPSPFELDDFENPFDLDDADVLTETAAATVKYLVRLALAEGNFGDLERQLIFQVLESTGEAVSQSQFERLAQQASREPLEVILKPILHQPTLFTEKLLLSGMLLTGVDGQVVTIEKKLLLQSCHLLGISRERYSEIAKDAVHLIKARRAYLSGNPAKKQIEASKAGMPSNQRPASTPAHKTGQPNQTVHQADPETGEKEAHSPQPSPLKKREVTTDESPAIKEPGSKETPRPRRNPEPVKKPQWRCPACHMPQFREFDECPQCGIIVAKFNAMISRSQPTEEYIDVPTVDETGASAAESYNYPQAEPSPCCPSCDTKLRESAKFCHACGHRIQ
jgi:hypothetical protein